MGVVSVKSYNALKAKLYSYGTVFTMRKQNT